MIFAVIAHAAPVIETIEAGCAGHLILHGSAAGEGGLVSGFDFHSGTLAVGLALSAKYRDGGSVGVGINVKTIVAGLEDREGLIGRVDFVSLAAEKMPDVQVERALIQFDLYDVVTDVGQRKAGLGIHPQGSASEMQFGARFLVGPDAIRGGQRTVHHALDPVVYAAWLNGDGSRNVLETHSASRRIRKSGQRRCRNQQRKKKIEKNESSKILHLIGPPEGLPQIRA